VNYKQKLIKVGQILLPEISCEKKKYYPLSYVFEKVLLKKKQSIKILKERGYEKELIQFKVDFTFNNAGTQNTYCISKEGLIDLLNKSNIGGLTVEQKQGMNSLLSYFNLDLIDEEPRYLERINYKHNSIYDEFEKDCIEETLKLDSDLIWQRCKDCGKYYPLHSNFFGYNTKHSIYRTVCSNCILHDNKVGIVHPDSLLNHIYKSYGYNIYINYKNHNTIEIYNHYLEYKTEYPQIIENKDDYLIIISYLYKNNKLHKDDITKTYLINEHRLLHITKHLEINEIYEYLFGNHPKEYPWHYKKYKTSVYNISEARLLFNNYLKENNIIIHDVYNFDYYEIAKKSRIGKDYYSNILKFVMEYYENEYPAYKFNIASVNYWKDKDNRDKALKYLIEKDMKLEIEKIPLYLTITSIRGISATMYNVLKNYYGSLYEWVNEIYPDMFDPKDFDINYMRNEFDSVDEQIIDEILRNSFDNVLYNPKHSEYTITLLGKIPDWFIFTTTGVIIVEYFGLWNKERGMYNSRTRDYINRSKDKIEKYKTLEWYKFLYIYPEDLHNDYEGLHKKIELIKNNKKYVVS